MPQSTFEKFLPASGILAGILFAISGYLPQTADTPSDNPITVMSGHEPQNLIAVIAAALFAVTLPSSRSASGRRCGRESPASRRTPAQRSPAV